MQSVVNFVKRLYGQDMTPEGKGVPHYFVLGSYGVLVLAGLLIPENILRDYPFARTFSDFMAAIIPQIDRITALGVAPDINRFYYSVLWTTFPLYFPIFLMSSIEYVERGYERKFSVLKVALLSLFAFLVCWLVMFLSIGDLIVVGRKHEMMWMFNNRLARALLAPMIVLGFQAMLASLIVMIKGTINKKILDTTEIRNG